MTDRLSVDADLSAVRGLLGPADPAGELTGTDRDRLARLGRQLQSATGTTGAAGGAPAEVLLGWVGRQRRGRRRRLLLGAAAPGVLLLTAASWLLATRGPDQVTGGVGCYAAARVGSSVDVVAATGDDPTVLCAQDWAAGPLHAQLPAGAPVPPLVACVLPHGEAVGVFPHTSCAALRLQPLPAGYSAQAARYAGMRDDLRDRFAATRCLPVPSGAQLARQTLARHGLTGWTVHVLPGGPDTPCAAFTPDPERHTITIVGQVSPDLDDAVQTALHSISGSCRAGSRPTDATTAVRAVTAALRRDGYGQWTVTATATPTPAQPCYAETVDPDRRRIGLDSTYTRT